MPVYEKYAETDSLMAPVKTRKVDNGWHEQQCRVCGNTIEVVRHDNVELDNCGACGQHKNVAQSLYDFYLAARKTGIEPGMDDRAFRSYEAFLERFKGLPFFENWLKRQDGEWLRQWNTELGKLRHSRGVVIDPKQARLARQQMEQQQKTPSRFLGKDSIPAEIEKEYEERRRNAYKRPETSGFLPKGRPFK